MTIKLDSFDRKRKIIDLWNILHSFTNKCTLSKTSWSRDAIIICSPINPTNVSILATSRKIWEVANKPLNLDFNIYAPSINDFHVPEFLFCPL